MGQNVRVVSLVIVFITAMTFLVEADPQSPALRRRYRSDLPDAVRRRLSTVSSEEQLIKDLNDVLYHGRTAVVRFYADWCPVCGSDRPKFLDLIDQFPLANFYRVNVDEHPKLTSEYGIRAVPTYFVLRRGMSHLTYHSARDVANYLTQLRQSRQLRTQHHQQRRSS